MPCLREHSICAKALLGYNIPAVHKLIDDAVKSLQWKHRYLTHNKEYIDLVIKKVFGDRGVNIAMVHILQDYGVIIKEDYSPLIERRKSHTLI